MALRPYREELKERIAAHRAWQRDYLKRAIELAAGNVSLASRLAGMNRTYFYRLAENLAIELPQSYRSRIGHIISKRGWQARIRRGLAHNATRD